MTKLSKKLQKYYSREDHRIVFINNMSLNQLAWEMWERLDYKGMDPSVLSRLINGQRVFTSRQLDVFCFCLAINESEKSKLYQLLQQDILSKFGWADNQFYPLDTYLFNLIEDDLVKINLIAAKDMPMLASEWIDQLYDRIHKIIPNLKSAASRKKMFRTLAKLLVQRKIVEFTMEDRDKLSQKIIQLPGELAFIAKETKDDEVLGNYYAIAGSISFYKKDYKTSMVSQEKAVSLIKSNIEKATTLSRLAITYGKLGKETEFLKAREYLYKLLPGFTDDFKCNILQMIAQGEMHARLYHRAQKTLYKSWSLYQNKVANSRTYGDMRKIQLVRTELELANASKDKSNKTHYEKIMNEAHFLITKRGYTTFSSDVTRFGKSLL